MSTPEQSPSSERSLSPEASQRIILRLKGFGDDPKPLNKDESGHLMSVIHRGQSKEERTLTNINMQEGKFLLDFMIAKPTAAEAVVDAVRETDTAVLRNWLPAEIEKAWIVPAGQPPVDWLMPDDYRKMSDVSPAAREISSDHQTELINRQIDHDIFNVA